MRDVAIVSFFFGMLGALVVQVIWWLKRDLWRLRKQPTMRYVTVDEVLTPEFQKILTEEVIKVLDEPAAIFKSNLEK